MTRAERFWKSVEKTATCWLWKGSTDGEYGQFWDGVRITKAHRYAYAICVGRIPKRSVLHHTCSNKRCVNPNHLVPCTNRQNMQRAYGAFVPSGHCRNGHKLTKANVRLKVLCLVCEREANKERMRKRRAVRSGR